jgi:hypothetical protein
MLSIDFQIPSEFHSFHTDLPGLLGVFLVAFFNISLFLSYCITKIYFSNVLIYTHKRSKLGSLDTLGVGVI